MVHVTKTTVTTNGKPDPVRLACMEALREEWLEILAKREAERKRIAEGR